MSLLLNREKEVDIGKELKEFKEFASEFPPEVCWNGMCLQGRGAKVLYSYEAKHSRTQT